MWRCNIAAYGLSLNPVVKSAIDCNRGRTPCVGQLIGHSAREEDGGMVVWWYGQARNDQTGRNDGWTM